MRSQRSVSDVVAFQTQSAVIMCGMLARVCREPRNWTVGKTGVAFRAILTHGTVGEAEFARKKRLPAVSRSKRYHDGCKRRRYNQQDDETAPGAQTPHGTAFGNCPAATAVRQRSFGARPATKGRSRTEPSVSLLHRETLGGGGAIAAGVRAGHARFAFARASANPFLVGPLVVAFFKAKFLKTPHDQKAVMKVSTP
jgi:hypothetical protein